MADRGTYGRVHCTINISITINIIIIIIFFRSSANGRQRDIWPFAPSIFQLQLRCTHRAAADKHNVFLYITNRHNFATLERERMQIDLIFHHVMCSVFKLYIVHMWGKCSLAVPAPNIPNIPPTPTPTQCYLPEIIDIFNIVQTNQLELCHERC